jgi:hypothetical protein
MGLPRQKDDRLLHRNRVLKRATILTGIANSETQCTVKNMHADGAELHVDLYARVPGEFLLYVPADGVAYKAVLRWRQDGRVGVMFVGTEEKPHWHYG